MTLNFNAILKFKADVVVGRNIVDLHTFFGRVEIYRMAIIPKRDWNNVRLIVFCKTDPAYLTFTNYLVNIIPVLYLFFLPSHLENYPGLVFTDTVFQLP